MTNHLFARNKKKSFTLVSYIKRLLRFFQSVNRLYSVFIHDLVMSIVAFFLSFQIVADIREFDWTQLAQNFVVFVCAAIGIFLITGLYRWMWRFVSRKDTVMVFIAATSLAAGYSLLILIMSQQVSIPAAFGLILWFALIACLLLPRFLFSFGKAYIEDYNENPIVAAKKPVLIFGTGEKAARFIRDHCSGRAAVYQAIGLISHHKDFIGRKVHGVSIRGTSSQIESVLKALKKEKIRTEKVLILEDDFSESDLNHVVKVLPRFNLNLYVFSWQPGKLTKIVASKEG